MSPGTPNLGLFLSPVRRSKFNMLQWVEALTSVSQSDLKAINSSKKLSKQQNLEHKFRFLAKKDQALPFFEAIIQI